MTIQLPIDRHRIFINSFKYAVREAINCSGITRKVLNYKILQNEAFFLFNGNKISENTPENLKKRKNQFLGDPSKDIQKNPEILLNGLLYEVLEMIRERLNHESLNHLKNANYS